MPPKLALILSLSKDAQRVRSLLTAAVLLSAGPAASQELCLDRQDLARHLAQVYGERLVAAGLAGPTALLEIFAAPGGSWTLVLTAPDGRSCIKAAGEAWRTRTPDPGTRS